MTSVYEKINFGKSAAYSCGTNVFIQFYRFKKKQETQLKTENLKQDILNQWESMGFSKLYFCFTPKFD